MKKNHLFTLFIIILSLGFTACNSDDPQRANTLTINGENFPLEKGYIQGDGPQYNITLMNGAIDENGRFNAEVTQYIYFEITSTSAAALAPGTYTFNPEEPSGTFSQIYISRGNSTQDGEWNENLGYFNATSGTVVVSKSGDTYTFECTFTFGDETITTYYAGTLELMPVRPA